ncbi:MAG: hypothetical protein R2867_19965 [Caldilineaceae bacterium]
MRPAMIRYYNRAMLSAWNRASIIPAGLGVRIEDTVAFTEAGELINLTEFPYDLVIPMG